MPGHDVTITANFTYDYNPSNPGEPSQGAGGVNIYGMTESGMRGQTVAYPVYLENSTPVSGMAVDMKFPQGFSVDASAVTLAGRAAGECRGVSRTVGGRLYITVYGDPSVPTPISFAVTDDATGETYEATEGMVFADDVVGSRHSPYTISIGATPDGISSALSGTPRLRVYTADGILVSGNATRQTLERLPKGVYIINGMKYVVK